AHRPRHGAQRRLHERRAGRRHVRRLPDVAIPMERTPCVTTERDGPVAVLRLDRPPVNALELGIAGDATAALDTVLGSDAGALAVPGAGRCSPAGLDLKLVPTSPADEQREMIAAANRLLAVLYTCPLPVVAAVNGNAIAGGLVIALSADHRVGP